MWAFVRPTGANNRRLICLPCPVVFFATHTGIVIVLIFTEKLSTSTRRSAHESQKKFKAVSDIHSIVNNGSY
jgi:hypothetical protein